MTNIHKLFILLSLSALLFPTGARSEITGAPASSFYNIPTPNAAELMRFGNVPVNHHLGTADISVPLYRYSYGGVELDIRLQYESSGLPMNRLPGWTGHGWTLLAGGSITRQKIGFPDDMSLNGTQAGSAYNNYHNYFDNHSVSTVFSSDISPDVFYFNFLGKSGRFFMGIDGQWKVISDDIIDVQTDVTNQSNYIDPFIHNIQIEGNVISYPKTVKGFTLVDENGTKYVFGGSTNSIEYSAPFLQPELYEPTVGPQNFWTADSWMLTRVADRFGNSLYEFGYERGKFMTQILPSNHMPSNSRYGYGRLLNGDYATTVNAPVYLSYVFINHGENLLSFRRENAFPEVPASRSVYPSFYSNGEPIWDCAIDARDIFYYAQTNYTPIQDYQATYPSINKHTDPLSIMEIVLLKDITSTDGASYSFTYDYEGRIHLNELTIHNGIGNNFLLDPDTLESYGKYRFVYNDYASVPRDYMTDNVDYWGYCNNISSNNGINGQNSNSPRAPGSPPEWPLDPGLPILPDDSLLIDDDDQEEIYPYNRRIPNYNCSVKGMLTDIFYPTGGSTHFEYEQNTCSNYIMQNNQVVLVRSEIDFEVPGLRINSISSFNTDSVLVEKKEFDYTDNGRSSGELYHVPVRLTYGQHGALLHPNDTIIKIVPVGLGLVEYDNGSAWGGGVNSLTPLWDSRGPHVGYQAVTESSSYGAKTYKYQGYTNALVLSAMGNPNTFCERQYCKGILLSELYYDEDHNMQKTINYSYGVGKVLSQIAAYLPEVCLGRIFTTVPLYDHFTLYTILFPRLCLSKMTQKELHGNNWVTTVKTYDYQDVDLTIETPYEHNSMIMLLAGESTRRMEDTLTYEYGYLNCVYNEGRTLRSGNREYVPCPGEEEPIINVLQYDSQSRSFFFPRISSSFYFNGEKVKESYTHYDCQFPGFDDYLQSYELEYRAGSLVPDTVAIYREYYSQHHKLKKYIDRYGIENTLLYSNGNLAGIARNCQGNVGYHSNGHIAPQGVFSSIPEEIYGTQPTSILECVYNDKGQIEKITSKNNKSFIYEYDLLGRLREIKDGNNNTLKTYQYNYRIK